MSLCTVSSCVLFKYRSEQIHHSLKREWEIKDEFKRRQRNALLSTLVCVYVCLEVGTSCLLEIYRGKLRQVWGVSRSYLVFCLNWGLEEGHQNLSVCWEREGGELPLRLSRAEKIPWDPRPRAFRFSKSFICIQEPSLLIYPWSERPGTGGPGFFSLGLSEKSKTFQVRVRSEEEILS